MKQYNNKKKMMIMVLCVAIVLAGNMQASAMVTADDILAGRNATEVSSAQVVMAEGVVICNELVPIADVMMYSNQNGSVKGDGVRLRAKPSTSATVLESMSIHEKVCVDMTKSKSQNYKWYYLKRVKTGTWGWVKAEYIRLKTT